MSNIQINTTQNVNIDIELASVGERVLASFIDLIIMLAYMYVISLVVNAFGIKKYNMDQWSYIAIIFTLYLPIMVYTITSELFFSGQTLGKKVLKIQVVKIDGYSASFSDYFIRWMFRIVDIWLFFSMPIIGLITVIVSENSQRFGGMASGTAVISLKNKYNISHTILEELNDAYKPTYPSVINLSDNDMRIIKDTFLMASKSQDYKTIDKLRIKVEEITKTTKGDNPNSVYLRTIMKDYTHYTQDM